MVKVNFFLKDKTESDHKEPDRKVDYNKFEDFVFEMNDFTIKREVLSTSTDNSIVIELRSSDEKDDLVAYSVIQLDDIHTLDLPILYKKENNECQVVDFNSEYKEEKSTDTTKLLVIDEMTEESAEKFDMLSKRVPMSFEMYKTKAISSTDVVCKLPLMFFWVRKPSILTLEKNTATKSVRDIVQELTGFDINEKTKEDINDIFKPKENRSAACSPMPITPSSPKRPPSSPSDRTESGKLNEKLEEIHEDYQ